MRIITSKDDKMIFGNHWAAGVYPSAFKKVNQVNQLPLVLSIIYFTYDLKWRPYLGGRGLPSCLYKPIRGQYTGHLITLGQSKWSEKTFLILSMMGSPLPPAQRDELSRGEFFNSGFQYP